MRNDVYKLLCLGFLLVAAINPGLSPVGASASDDTTNAVKTSKPSPTATPSPAANSPKPASAKPAPTAKATVPASQPKAASPGNPANPPKPAPTKKDSPETRPEVRAIWVDAFHDGAKTPAQIDQLIQDCLRANLNTIMVQVRRRGDAYYNKSIEPRTQDPRLPANFDPLQYLIDKAHPHHLEVHAWLNTMVAWNGATAPPKDPTHIWNLHGPSATGSANWFSYSRQYNPAVKKYSDKLNPSNFLDPGHPGVIDYIVKVYLNLVENYDIDGIHLDYSRYEGAAWGYNATSVKRYNAQSGTTGLPEPSDPRWIQWRRDQVGNLIRKVYLKTIAAKPSLKVSSAVISWGDGPDTEPEWEKTQPYTTASQDWNRWLKEGIIDAVFPMNYFFEWNPARKAWYDKWIEWEKNHQYNRQIVIGTGVYMQYIEDALEQIRRAQEPSNQGRRAAGVALFAYGWNNIYSNDEYKKTANSKLLPRQPHVFLPEANDWLFNLLSKAGSYPDPITKAEIATKPVFPAPAPIPDMPWKSRPAKGYLTGTLLSPAKKPYDHFKVLLESSNTTGVAITRIAYTDGSGWFGLAELPPGNYEITVAADKYFGYRMPDVTIQAGKITEANFTLSEKKPTPSPGPTGGK